MKNLLDIINQGVFRGLNEHKIELLTDLEDDALGQLNSIQAKSMNNKIDQSIKGQLTRAIQTGEIYDGLKRFINDPNNFCSLKGIIKANDKDHLRELIEIGQELLGNDGNFNWIDTSGITDMTTLFFDSYFNGHIELWDVSNVTNMRRMFEGAVSFNQPIGNWDVSNVTNMKYMFAHAYKFNQPIRDWDVSNVTDMDKMFEYALKFNQPLYNWDVSKVIYYDRTFKDCPIDEEYKPKFK